MKTCPQCGFNVPDEMHRFCPIDGSALSESSDRSSYSAPVNLSSSAETVDVADGGRKFKLRSSPRVEDNTAQPVEPIMSFNVSRFYQSARDESELYEITRGFWKIFRSRAEQAKYAFSIFRGEIKEVYKIEKWEPACVEESKFWTKYKREQGEPLDLSINNGRYQFVGQRAPENIRQKYLGKRLDESVSKFPVNYFNC